MSKKENKVEVTLLSYLKQWEIYGFTIRKDNVIFLKKEKPKKKSTKKS